MDEKCDICGGVIRESESRFYIVYASRECHRESWEVIGYVCPKCFFCGRMSLIKEGG